MENHYPLFTDKFLAVGKHAGIRLMQRVVDIVELGSLGHDKYVLSVSLKPRQHIAGGGLRRPGWGLI